MRTSSSIAHPPRRNTRRFRRISPGVSCRAVVMGVKERNMCLKLKNINVAPMCFRATYTGSRARRLRALARANTVAVYNLHGLIVVRHEKDTENVVMF